MSFTGTYDRNLDDKGRVALPPTFKKPLDGLTLKVIYAPEREVDAVYVFEKDAFEKWLDSVFAAKGGFNPTDPVHRTVQESLRSEATELKMDSASRISIPENDRASAHLDHEVSIVGNGDRLEIWDRATHEARRAAARDVLADFFG